MVKSFPDSTDQPCNHMTIKPSFFRIFWLLFTRGYRHTMYKAGLIRCVKCNKLFLPPKEYNHAFVRILYFVLAMTVSWICVNMVLLLSESNIFLLTLVGALCVGFGNRMIDTVITSLIFCTFQWREAAKGDANINAYEVDLRIQEDRQNKQNCLSVGTTVSLALVAKLFWGLWCVVFLHTALLLFKALGKKHRRVICITCILLTLYVVATGLVFSYDVLFAKSCHTIVSIILVFYVSVFLEPLIE